MLFFKRLTAIFVAFLLLCPALPLAARTRKGDKFLSQGRALEAKKDWGAALELYENALAEDPSEITYQMAVEKARFQAAQMHVDRGTKIRATGQLGEALLEFQRAYLINPASAVAAQEIVRTDEMIQRERQRVQQTGRDSAPEQRALTPADAIRKETRDRINRLLPVPELKPINPEAVKNLKISGQPVKGSSTLSGK